jgi:hypothetical protein
MQHPNRQAIKGPKVQRAIYPSIVADLLQEIEKQRATVVPAESQLVSVQPLPAQP